MNFIMPSVSEDEFRRVLWPHGDLNSHNLSATTFQLRRIPLLQISFNIYAINNTSPRLIISSKETVLILPVCTVASD